MSIELVQPESSKEQVHETWSRLSKRARHILYAAISEYIQSGGAVSSQSLVNKHGLDCSPATMRNELAELEGQGALFQPHPSAGRVPTELGFKLFIHAIALTRELHAKDHKETLLEKLKALKPHADEVIQEACKLLSELAGAATVFQKQQPEVDRITQLRFIPIHNGQLLSVIIFQTGTVQNRMIAWSEPLDARTLEHMHRHLEDVLSQPKTFPELLLTLNEDLEKEQGTYLLLANQVMHLVDALGPSPDQGQGHSLIIEGQSILFDRPEFKDSEKIRAFIHAFEDKNILSRILSQTSQVRGVQVLIGTEATLRSETDVSIITSGLAAGASSIGSIAVVGPTRMDYERVVPWVGAAAEVISALESRKD